MNTRCSKSACPLPALLPHCPKPRLHFFTNWAAGVDCLAVPSLPLLCEQIHLLPFYPLQQCTLLHQANITEGWGPREGHPLSSTQEIMGQPRTGWQASPQTGKDFYPHMPSSYTLNGKKSNNLKVAKSLAAFFQCVLLGTHQHSFPSEGLKAGLNLASCRHTHVHTHIF